MPMIQLTQATYEMDATHHPIPKEKVIYINPLNVLSITSSGNEDNDYSKGAKTEILLDRELSWSIKETPEEVLELLNQYV